MTDDLLDFLGPLYNNLQYGQDTGEALGIAICEYCKTKPAAKGHKTCRRCFYNDSPNQTALDSRGIPKNQYAFEREQAEERHQQGW